MKDETNYMLPKSPTGIVGLDDLTIGGFPQNRATLLLGNTGCGKTVMAMEFIVNGIEKYNEPGVFITLEEEVPEVIVNVKSMGYDLERYISENKLYIEHIKLEEDANEQTAKGSIEGLFRRIEEAIDKVKAKRIVLDSLDALFYGFNYYILRSEFKRLVTMLKEKNVTAIITAETEGRFISRRGLEEYVADCVIYLENRVSDLTTTRFLRIVKYRGSRHATSEYPFVIDDRGVIVFPLTEPLSQQISSKIVSTGIPDLDNMFDKKGIYAGSSVLISGTAGTGKTSIASSFANKACQESVNCVYCAFEESPDQICRNMKSIGIDFEPWVKSGKLIFYASRPTIQNIELHFNNIRKIVVENKPSMIIVDPITNLMSTGPNSSIRLMLTRFVDFLKTYQITLVITAAITEKLIERNPSDEGISSLVDTWIMVGDAEAESERKRTFTIMKSRGTGHSKMVMELVLNDGGIFLHEIEHMEYH